MENPSTPPPNEPEPAVPSPNASGLSGEERMWAMIGHLSALAGILTGGIGNIVGPLIVWQMKKETMPFAAAEAKEALNFNITWMLGFLVLLEITFLLVFVLIGFFLIPVLWAVGIAWIIFSIIAGIKANEGKPYRYPRAFDAGYASG